MNMTEICTGAVHHYGAQRQLVKAIEEMSELTKELCKGLGDDFEHRIDNITEEIADVEIMLEQLKIICENRFGVELQRDAKLRRLQRRINGEPD